MHLYFGHTYLITILEKKKKEEERDTYLNVDDEWMIIKIMKFKKSRYVFISKQHLQTLTGVSYLHNINGYQYTAFPPLFPLPRSPLSVHKDTISEVMLFL